MGLKRDGTRPCYTFDFGDGSSTQYIGSGCLPGRRRKRSLNPDFTLSHKSITFFHDYEEPGIFVLTITGENDLSNDKFITTIPVNLAPCNPVVAKILGSGQEEAKPRIEYRSRKASIYSEVQVGV